MMTVTNDSNKETVEDQQKILHESENKVKQSSRLNFLLGLVENEEYGEIDIFDFMEPSMSAFAEILCEKEKMKIWNDFLNYSEEDQEKVLKRSDEKNAAANNEKKSNDNLPEETTLSNTEEEWEDLRIAHPAYSAEECFKRIDSNLKSILKRRHLPKGTLSYLEEEVTEFFTDWPTSVFISHLSNSYERLLLHAVCQYLDLISQSVVVNDQKQTEVENKYSYFHRPPMSLTNYLESRR
ncbi:R3H domain-containing protein 4-like isoform X2 [Tubulanus polymorphus]|uniref:R3H domain-containing protein 4-like isoform X2 n=1 Tax=Tubulanus polymorphus TaxID=672921 RepID=UPI003DA5DDB9